MFRRRKSALEVVGRAVRKSLLNNSSSCDLSVCVETTTAVVPSAPHGGTDDEALDYGSVDSGVDARVRHVCVRAGRRRESDRNHSGSRHGRAGRSAARRDGDGHEPVALGAQTTVTSETGNYRFPAVPPGDYELTYELAGFNTVKREGIQISLGFTAT